MLQKVLKLESGQPVDHAELALLRKNVKAQKIHTFVNNIELVQEHVGSWSEECLDKAVEKETKDRAVIGKARQLVVCLCASQMLSKRTDKPRAQFLQLAEECALDKKTEIPPALRFEMEAALSAAA